MPSGSNIQCLSDLLSSIPKGLSPILKHPEHILKFAEQLLFYQQNNSLQFYPVFSEECTPFIEPIIAPFRLALTQWYLDETQGRKLFTEAFEKADLKDVLLVLGQRYTSSSVTDERAIPPLKSQLLHSFNVVHKHSLSVGAKAWTKHVSRSDQSFWGEVKGNDKQKNEMASNVLLNILENTTWWNVFEHYKHQLIYEIRVPSGHGARWTSSGTLFIGFLEPFI